MFLRESIKKGLVFCLPLVSFSSTSAQFTLLYQKDGDTTSQQLGYSVAGAGDVNGDGRADFIVGAPFAVLTGLADQGMAIVYSGADGSPVFFKLGAAAGDQLGISVAGAGDVNGDGRADFIIGAPFGDPSGLTDAGSAYVYSGADGSLLYEKDGTSAYGLLGFSVASAGDVNGDGKADFIIGAYNANPSAFVYSGADGSLLYQKNGPGALGFSVASAGDVNGDGKADFIVGAPNATPGGLINAGSAYVYSGADGSLLYQKNGERASDELGRSVAPAGDVNGDGRGDFIIGAYPADPGGLINAGSAYVYSGADGSLLYQKNGDSAGIELGRSVASAGDVNGDGRADFIIGAWHAAGRGTAYLYSGADGSLLFQKNGAAALDYLGISVASAGDVNGDGRADIIIGAYSTDPGGLIDAGSAFVYSLPAPLDPPVNLTPIFEKDNARAVAGAGDVNGDGRADFIIGNPDNNAITGSAHLYSGATGVLLYQKNGDTVGAAFGTSVARVGDVDGDGRSDFIVGANGTNGRIGSAYVYSGATGDLIYQKDGVIGGPDDPPVDFGFAVAGSGDVDGDGRTDFIVGAFNSEVGGVSNAGRVYVYSGSTGALVYEKTNSSFNNVGGLGFSVANAGDINGDGKADFIVGAPSSSPSGLSGAGSIFIYSGLDGSLLFRKDGDSAGAGFGYSVGSAGDVNGDGRADFVVGADWEGIDSTGRIFVYSGADGALLYKKSGTRGAGGYPDAFGASVSGAGDVNGDGRDDFIVGAPSADPGGIIDAGAAYVYSGATGNLLSQLNGQLAGEQFGRSVAGIGDINGDGKADVIAGGYSYGVVFAVNRKPLLAPIGSPTGTEGQLLAFTVSASDPDGFLPMLSVADTSAGMAFADTGNGGGRFVWTPQPYQVGIHHVKFIASDGFLADTQSVTVTVLADTLTAQKNGANPGDALGFAVAGGGDVNGDGVADYIIGAPFADVQLGGEAVVLADAGAAYVYSGKNDSLLYQVNGDSTGDRVGGSVGLWGDVNGDGKADFMVGAPGAHDSAGSVYVYSGANGSLIYQKTGSVAGDRVGGSVGISGDLDADGHSDFIVGAPGVNNSAGAAYVYSGLDGSLLYQKSGSTPGDRVGGSVGIYGVYTIIGAPDANGSAGTVLVDSGATGVTIFQKDGSIAGDRVGGSVGISGEDFIIGAPGANDFAGSAYVYSLSKDSLLFQVNGASAGDRVGGSVGITGDINGDGTMDFAVGAPGFRDSAGAVYVYSGLTGSPLFQKAGDSTGERVGGSVGIFENVDGSQPRILVGAPGADPGGKTDAGSAFLFQTEKKGDLNNDGVFTPADVVHMLNCVFLGSSLGVDCNNLSVIDLSCDGTKSPVDVVRELNAVFMGASTACSF